MKIWKAGLVTGACAAACAAPLAFAPLAAGLTFASAGLLGCLTDVGGLAALALVAGGGVWFWQRRSAAKRQCACSPDGGCNTATSCDIPSAT